MIRKVFLTFVSLTIVIAVMAQKNQTPSTQCNDKFTLSDKADTLSYILGADIGKSFKQNGISVIPEILLKGLVDALAGKDTIFSNEQREEIMMALQGEIIAKQQEQQGKISIENKKKGENFMEENKKVKDVITLPSGLQYKVVTLGKGTSPKATDNVTVHYKGMLLDGSVFDSSYDRNEPATFPLNGVIAGWTEGLQLMAPGAKYIFYIPAHLGYGDRDMGVIPPGSTLVFEVELISVN